MNVVATKAMAAVGNDELVAVDATSFHYAVDSNSVVAHDAVAAKVTVEKEEEPEAQDECHDGDEATHESAEHVRTALIVAVGTEHNLLQVDVSCGRVYGNAYWYDVC